MICVGRDLKDHLVLTHSIYVLSKFRIPSLVTEDKLLDSFLKRRYQVPLEMSQDTWEHCTKVADVAHIAEEIFPSCSRTSGRTLKGHEVGSVEFGAPHAGSEQHTV